MKFTDSELKNFNKIADAIGVIHSGASKDKNNQQIVYNEFKKYGYDLPSNEIETIISVGWDEYGNEDLKSYAQKEAKRTFERKSLWKYNESFHNRDKIAAICRKLGLNPTQNAEERERIWTTFRTQEEAAKFANYVKNDPISAKFKSITKPLDYGKFGFGVVLNYK